MSPKFVHIGLGIKPKDGYYILAVHFSKGGNHMSGPHEIISALDKASGTG